MTGQREVTRYASPSLTKHHENTWEVIAQPWGEQVGMVQQIRGPLAAGWTAATPTNHYAGLWPTKQAAAEVLVKQAGYELERS